MAKKILIIDDDQDDIISMSSILKKEGYNVVTEEDGTKALEIVKGNGFNLILIDIKMPSLSGYSLLRLIREKINHDAKMLYVSIIPEKEVHMEDIDGFIQKPFSPSSLLKEVKKALD